MNKKSYLCCLIITFAFITLITAFYSFKNYSFGIDAVYKIEEQRREHVNFLFKESALYHNKLFYFVNKTIDIYLQYLSPSAIFSVNVFPVSIINFIIFCYGIFIILVSKKTYKNALLYLLLVTPLLPASMLLKPSLLSLYLFQAPVFVFLIINIINKVKNRVIVLK